MRLTSSNHRGIAKHLRQQAAKLPKAAGARLHKNASLHLGLARAQESNPELAPNQSSPPSGAPLPSPAVSKLASAEPRMPSSPAAETDLA